MLAIIIGRRRQGKSTLALALARAEHRSTIIFDPNDQYRAIESIAVEALDQWMVESTPDSVCRIVPSPPVEESWQALADVLDGGVWRWGEYSLILDECSMLMSPHALDERLERYVRTAPRDVSLVMTTHRPRDIHPLVRALASDLFVFQSRLARDLDVLKENYGEEVAAKVADLRPYWVLHHWLDVGGRPAYDVWDRPEEWYIDIGRTS